MIGNKMKKYLFCIMMFLLGSCASSLREADFRCPRVVIPADKAYLTQLVGYADNFRVELIGYEGYCYMETNALRRYAVITPKFRAVRLHNHDETGVDFVYYTEIVQGPPEFLGKQTYFASTDIGLDSESVTFSGRPVKVKIPLDRDDTEIILGLDISAAEDAYNRRTFAPMTVDKTESLAQPAKQPASSQSSGCNTCSLRN